MTSKKVHFSNGRLLNQLHCGKTENLGKAEDTFGVELVARENWLSIEGTEKGVALCEEFFEILRMGREQGFSSSNGQFIRILEQVAEGNGGEYRELYVDPIQLQVRKTSVVPRNLGQKRYLQSILRNDVIFGIGPAGTGKTFLAMTTALHSLLNGEVKKIVLARPAVEAGEALGFLPGDLEEKLLPYLRPLYDAMDEILGSAEARKLVETGLVEIAPLAYMRGRTLSNCFALLDEAQNTTSSQMMMFLTRLGEGSKMVVTGDVTQVDLPNRRASGLVEVEKILENVDGIDFHHFQDTDVVRHPLVSEIIRRYGERSDQA